MHPADHATRLDREAYRRKQEHLVESSALAAQAKAKQQLLVELLDIANGNCPDLEGGLAFVAKVLHEHLSSHP